MSVRESLCDGAVGHAAGLADVKGRRDGWTWPFCLDEGCESVAFMMLMEVNRILYIAFLPK